MIGVKQIPIDINAQRYAYASGITHFEQKRALHTLAVGLKPGRLLSKHTALYPMLGINATTTKFNFINPRDSNSLAYTLVFENYPTFSYRGVDWNGTNQYANTGVNPSTVIAEPSALSYYSRDTTNTATDEIDIGCTDGSTSFWLSCYYNASGFTSSLSRNNSNSVLLTGSNVTPNAYYVTSKKTTNAALYRNRTQLTTATDSSSLPNRNIYIGCFNANGTPALFTNRQCALASILTGVTAAEEEIMYSVVQQYQTILWQRQV